MLPESHRRLWKRRLRRRPLLPFLLAATLAIDLVLAATDITRSMFSAGFLLGQMSLLAIWTTSSLRGMIARACLSSALMIALIEIFLRISDRTDAVLGPVLLVVMLGKSIAAGTAYASRRLLTKKLVPQFRLRFSIASLLTMSLLIAFVGTTSNRGEWAALAGVQFLLLVAGESAVVLVMTGLAIFTTGWIRKAALIGLPLLCVGLSLVLPLGQFNQETSYYTSIQAAVMGIWLMALGVRGQSFTQKHATDLTPTPLSEPHDDYDPSDPDLGQGPMTLPLRFDAHA